MMLTCVLPPEGIPLKPDNKRPQEDSDSNTNMMAEGRPRKAENDNDSAWSLVGQGNFNLKDDSEPIATPATSKTYRRRPKVQRNSTRPPTSVIEEASSQKHRPRMRSSTNSDSVQRNSKPTSSRRRHSAQEVKYSDSEKSRYFPRLRGITESKDYKRCVHTSSASADSLWADARKMAFADQVRKNGSWTKKPSSYKSHTSPSVISILSEMTNASGGSSGSNSTVTQESISRAKPPRAKRSSTGRVDSKGRTKKESTLISRSISPTITERPNVFAFMENESTTTVAMPTKAASAVEDESLDRRIPSGLPDVISESELEDDDEPSARIYSDSGTLARGDSPARAAGLEANASENVGRRFAPPYNAAFVPPRVAEQVRAASYTSPLPSGTRRWSNASDSGMGSSVDENCGYDQSNHPPEAYYAGAYPKVAVHPDELPLPYASPQSNIPQSVSDRPHPIPTAQPRSHVAGYELLASKLSSNPRGTDTLIPIYRKFETLNNRILLYLQDEICEIEEDLRKLDEADAQLNAVMSDETGHTLSTSRRREAKMPSEIHFRRLELLGRAFLKVGQYSKLSISSYPRTLTEGGDVDQALSSYSSLIKGLDSAKGAEIEAYQAWIDEHSTIVESETDFLNHKADLLSLTSRTSQGRGWRGHSSPVSHLGSAPAYMAFVVSGAAVLIPLLSFSVISEFLGRLFVIFVVGGVATAMMAPSRAGSFMKWDELRPCLAIYAGILILVAGILS